MLRRSTPVLAAFALLALFAAGTAHAEGEALQGLWKVKSMQSGGEKMDVPEGMTMTIEFKATGEFRMVMVMGDQREEEKGRWEAKGNKVKIIDADGSVDELTWTVSGKKLRLEKKEANEILEAVR